jgi:hypothetical protein
MVCPVAAALMQGPFFLNCAKDGEPINVCGHCAPSLQRREMDGFNMVQGSNS